MRAHLDEPLGYTNAAGLHSLRRRLAERYDGVESDRILVVAGASAGFTLAFLTLFEPGARVGVLEPGYPCYRNALLALGIEAGRRSRSGRRAGGRRRPADLDAAGQLDGLVLASPSNPTGTVLRADALAEITAACRSRGIAVIADEIYHGIVDGPPAARVLDHHPDAFVVNSFSKYWSMTGWRVGWVVVPDSLVDTVERLQQNLYICAPHVSQVAALAALDATDELDGHVARYRREPGDRRSTASPRRASPTSPPPTARSTCTPTFLTSRRRSASTRCNSPHAGSTNSAWPPRRAVDFDLARGHEYVRFSYAGAGDRHGRGLRPARRVGAMTTDSSGPSGPDPDQQALAGLRVIDMSTVLAGPNCARYLADFGADVIKVERPGGDSLRNMAWRDPRDGEGLWWKLVNRNKRTVVLDVKDDDDRDVLLSLIDDAHVLVENSRPGTMERLGLGPDVLLERNPDLVMTRVSGFGQDGPYASRPGFATIAEAMSGLAALSGEPDGQPLLPPIALTDELTGLAAAFATMVALHSGVGQVVDANLLETMFQMMGPLASVYAVRGEQQPRLGAGLPYTVPRGTYRCADEPLGGGVDVERFCRRAGDGGARRR